MKQRNAAEVNALRDRGATLEMVPNPMWEQPSIADDGAGAGAEARPYSTPLQPVSTAGMYAVPTEKGGIAYASSAPLASPAYENSSMLIGDRGGSMESSTQQ
eukprot:gene13355-9154_t